MLFVLFYLLRTNYLFFFAPFPVYLIKNFIVYICIFLNIPLFRVQKKQAKKFSSLKSFLSASVRSPERSPELLRYIVQTTSSVQYIYIVLQSVVQICSFCLRVSACPFGSCYTLNNGARRLYNKYLTYSSSNLNVNLII